MQHYNSYTHYEEIHCASVNIGEWYSTWSVGPGKAPSTKGQSVADLEEDKETARWWGLGLGLGLGKNIS